MRRRCSWNSICKTLESFLPYERQGISIFFAPRHLLSPFADRKRYLQTIRKLRVSSENRITAMEYHSKYQ